MASPPYEVHIVSHTHWDREWYRPFQQFRFQLVEAMDRLLDLMARNPSYRYFLLDGQTIILRDYLDIRPEREAELRRLIGEGRITIGPWHVLPDEFLVSPEATVRNLMLGARVCAEFGSRMPIGYTPDPFGHIAQLPQILKGVGLEAAALERGLLHPATELWWEAPDGTRIFTHYLYASYGSFAWTPPSATAFTARVRELLGRLGPAATTPHLMFMNGTDHMMPEPRLPALIDAANALLDGEARLQHSTMPAYLDAVRAALGDAARDLDVVRGELREPRPWNVLPGVFSARMWIKQRNAASQVALERYAEPLVALTRCLGGTDRHGEIWRAWEYLIENHPHDSICGCSIDQVHEEMRTRFDWCDQIANQVTVAALRELGGFVNTAALPAPARPPESDAPSVEVRQSGHDLALLVFNPAQAPATARIEADIPWAGPNRAYQLLDDEGNRIPIRWLEIYDRIEGQETLTGDRLDKLITSIELGFIGWRAIQDVRVWIDPGTRRARLDVVMPEYHTGEVGDFAALAATLRENRAAVDEAAVTYYLAGPHRMAFVARDVPGVGYRAYRLQVVPGVLERDIASPTEQRAIENEYLRVEADPTDGTLTIHDKTTGATYTGLNAFEDRGDRGDEYNFCPVEHDTLVNRPARRPWLRAIDMGIEGQTLTVGMEYEIPMSLSPTDRHYRITVDESEFGELAQHVSPATVLELQSTVQLTPGVRRVDIRTVVNNRAENHRLRALFPTGIASDIAIADSHFDRIKRPPLPPFDPADYQEQPQPTAPMLAFVAATDGERGLMLAARGLPEYELIPGEHGATLALTLLRCVGWLSRDDLATRRGHAGPELPTPGAQMIGEHHFEYSLIPFGDDLDAAAHAAYSFAAPPRAVALPLAEGPLPARGALVTLEPGALVLTAVKPAERGEGLIVRFYNSAESTVTGRVRFGLPVRQVTPTNLLEEPVGDPLELDETRACAIDVSPKRIITLHVI